MSDHDHDEEGNCIGPFPQDSLYPNGLPTWRFSGWDVAGILLTGFGGLATVLGQVGHLLARECSAMANWSRAEREHWEVVAAEEAARREMAESYEKLVGLDTYWLESGEPVEDES